MRIPWLTINNSNSLFFFCKITICWVVIQFWTQTRQQYDEYESKIVKEMDLNILQLTYFLILKRRSLPLFSLTERSLTSYCHLRFVSVFSPRSLTLSVGYNLLPLNFIFKSPSNFFCLDFLPFQFFLHQLKIYLHLTN